jgi:hypothetical protein
MYFKFFFLINFKCGYKKKLKILSNFKIKKIKLKKYLYMKTKFFFIKLKPKLVNPYLAMIHKRLLHFYQGEKLLLLFIKTNLKIN